MPVIKVERTPTDKTAWNVNPFLHAKRVYINFVQKLFREGNPLELIYRPDIKTTDIMIVEGGLVNSTMLGKKPAVAVSRDNARIVLQSIGGLSEQKMGGYMVREEMLTFQLVTNILSSSDVESEEIAWYIMSNTQVNFDILCSEGFYIAGNDIIATPPGSAVSAVEGDAGGLYLVRIIMPARVIVKFRIDPVNYEILKAVHLDVENPAGEALGTVKVEST